MKKGITPVVTTILLLIISIVVIGLAFFFFTRTIQNVSENAGNQINTSTNNMGKLISIDNLAANSITIRNTGTTEINVSELNIYVANAQFNTASCDWSNDILSPGKLSTLSCTGISICSSNDKVRVTSPITEDSEICHSSSSSPARTINIDSLEAYSLKVRNTGTARIDVSELSIYTNNVPYVLPAGGTCSWSSATIDPNQVLTFTCVWMQNPAQICTSGQTIKVVGPENEDSEICPSPSPPPVNPGRTISIDSAGGRNAVIRNTGSFMIQVSEINLFVVGIGPVNCLDWSGVTVLYPGATATCHMNIDCTAPNFLRAVGPDNEVSKICG